jgi:hypothetical protein
MNRIYPDWSTVDFDSVKFAKGYGTNNKPKITLTSGLSFLTPALRTNWPFLGGDGNYGTKFGSDEQKDAKYVCDLTSMPISDQAENHFDRFAEKLAQADDALLQFMYENQELIGRQNLSKENVEVLQNKSVKTKRDEGGNPLYRSFYVGAKLYQYNASGSKARFHLPICDGTGTVMSELEVTPGDIISVCAHAKSAYLMAGKFGIQWCLEAVSVLAKGDTLPAPKHIAAFAAQAYPFQTPMPPPKDSESDPETMEDACGSQFDPH